MAVKQYRALRDGYVDGRVVKAGETFATDFRELVRDESKPAVHKGSKSRNGEPEILAVYPIKRDKNGEAVTKDGGAPTWAEEITPKEANAQAAANGDFADPVFEDMSKDALVAYCATNSIPFDAKMSKADLVAACHAQTDYKT